MAGGPADPGPDPSPPPDDVEVAEQVHELHMQQIAHEAALGALGRALPGPLLHFLA